MSFTHSLIRGWSGTNGVPLTPAAQALTGKEEINFSFSLAASTNDEQHPLAFTKTLLQSIYILSSDVDITIKTNNNSPGQDVLALTAGVPFVWSVDDGIANPFLSNVTTAYFTNGNSTTATKVDVRCLTNG